MNNQNQFAELVAAVGSVRKVGRMLKLSKSRVSELKNNKGVAKQEYVSGLRYCVGVMRHFQDMVSFSGSVSAVSRNSGLSRRQINRLRKGDFTARRNKIAAE